MKSRRVLWSCDALEDLKSAVDFIAERNPAAAKRVAGAIRQTGRSLGRAATGRPGRVGGTYEKVVRGLPYLIAYSIETPPVDGEIVLVLRVIHGSRNWASGAWPSENQEKRR